jgi:hypothetical protein
MFVIFVHPLHISVIVVQVYDISALSQILISENTGNVRKRKRIHIIFERVFTFPFLSYERQGARGWVIKVFIIIFER